MSSERIGKLEKWILIHTYKKIILHEVPIGWKIPRWAKSTEAIEYKKHQSERNDFEDHFDEDGIVHWTDEIKFTKVHLLKSEVMLNYFNLARSGRSAQYTATKQFSDVSIVKEKFRSTKKYKSALASYSRTSKNMVEKGLITKEFCSGILHPYHHQDEMQIMAFKMAGKEPPEGLKKREYQDVEGISLTIAGQKKIETEILS